MNAFESFRRRFYAEPYGTVPLILRILREHGLPHWRSYAFLYAMMGVTAGATSLWAWLIGSVINQAYIAHSFAGILSLSLVIIVTFAVKGLAAYGQNVALASINTELTAENTQKSFNKLLSESLAWFADRPSSVMMSQVTYGAGAIPIVLGLLMNAAGRDALTLIGLASVMVVQEPLMSLIAVVVLPPALFCMRMLRERVRALVATQFGGTTALMEAVQESLQGLRVVKSFGLEELMRSRVSEAANQMKQAGNELARLSNRSGPIMEVLGGFALALLVLYGGWQVIENGAAPGQFVSFIMAFFLAYEPAKRLARLHLDLVNGLLGARILFQILDSPPTEPDEGRKPTLRVGAGRVDFIDVEFAYRPGEPVLRGISFAAEPGRVTALVGPSGGGKSTVFSLILRLYEPTTGAIVIDGQDIGTVSRRSVREQIAYVGQDVFLFRGTILQNIWVGDLGATEADIMAAAKAAHAHDFIMSFPKGYHTPVGEHGLQLSAGQRQRVSVARALLRNAQIILLDEPTAALDMESEREVQRAIADLCAGRTTLVIAHRLHTVTAADCIHVVEDGRVVESGSHAELLRKSGRYAGYRQLLREEAPA